MYADVSKILAEAWDGKDTKAYWKIQNVIFLMK